MGAARAVKVGWNSLKESFRMWGITAREHPTLWLRRQGFPGTRPEPHWSASPGTHDDRSQQVRRSRLFVGSVVCGHHDARSQSDGPQVGSIAAGDESLRRPHRSHRHRATRIVGTVGRRQRQRCLLEEDPNVEELSSFLERTSSRRVWIRTPGERLRAKHEGDVVGESRAWKLFVPNDALAPTKRSRLSRTRRARKEGRRIHTRQVDPVDQRSSATRGDIWLQRFQRA